MYCPTCRTEYRAGFSTCADCGVPLVHSLDEAGEIPHAGSREVEQAGEPPYEPTAPYCGFLTLDEARSARSRLWGEGFRAEILVREGEGGHAEEYWILVPRRATARVQQILGFDPAVAEEAGTIACSECGGSVAEDASVCPHCGAQFEEG